MDKLGNRIHLTLPPEDDDGDVEYKWNLARMNDYKRTKITSQMRWRVEEASGNQSTLYVLGVHDNGQLTGLCRDNLIATYTNLVDCAGKIGLYTCLRRFGRINESDSYWAIMQVFSHPMLKCNIRTDHDLPQIPQHPIPEYIPNKM